MQKHYLFLNNLVEFAVLFNEDVYLSGRMRMDGSIVA